MSGCRCGNNSRSEQSGKADGTKTGNEYKPIISNKTQRACKMEEKGSKQLINLSILPIFAVKFVWMSAWLAQEKLLWMVSVLLGRHSLKSFLAFFYSTNVSVRSRHRRDEIISHEIRHRNIKYQIQSSIVIIA